jgi:hypothetical protein
MMDGTRRKETAAPPAPARVTQQKPPPESNTCQSRGGGTQTAKLAGRAPKTKSTNETNMDRRRCTRATNHKKKTGEREDKRSRAILLFLHAKAHAQRTGEGSAPRSPGNLGLGSDDSGRARVPFTGI